MLKEILRQYSVTPVEWLLLITLMQVFHRKDQQVRQNFKNVQFREKWVIRKLKVVAKPWAEKRLWSLKKLAPFLSSLSSTLEGQERFPEGKIPHNKCPNLWTEKVLWGPHSW